MVLTRHVLMAAIAAISAACAGMAQDKESSLWDWRVGSSNIDVRSVGELDGRERVLAVAYSGGSDQQKRGRIEFGCAGLGLPIDAWIPPYVGTRARRLVYSVRLMKPCGNRVFLKMSKDQREIWREELVSEEKWPTGRWSAVAHDIRLAGHERVARVALQVDGTNSMAFALSDIRLVLDDGSTYDLMDAGLPKYETGMVRPLATSASKPFPKRPRMQFGVGAGWYAKHSDELPAMGEFFRKHLPEYDIVLSLDGTPEPMIARTIKDAPGNIFFQFQKGRNAIKYLGLRDALIKDLHGNQQPEVFNSVHGCSPLVREALEDQIAYVGSLGINNVQQFDYTWYYPKGPWGFDEYSAAAFREDLSETDEGLVLGTTKDEPEHTVHFWDYYECYEGTGTRFGPDRLGLGDWGVFCPAYDSPMRIRLHWLLVSYEWLRQAQRFGQWSRKYCNGIPHDFLLNGEGSVNGNDHVFLERLRDTGIASGEYFHGTCPGIGIIYHRDGRYIREARRYGKVRGITLETSSGGGSTQAYWSCRTGYVISYVLSAMGHESFHYDHMPDGASWNDHLDKANKYGVWKNLALGMSCARAYRQAKIDGTHPLPFGGVLYVHERTVARSGESFAFAHDLVRNGIDYGWTDPQELPKMIGLAKTVIVSPRLDNRDAVPLLKKWKSSGEGRQLVVAKGDVSRIAEKCGLPRIQLNAAADEATALPFRCGSFSVAALFNRVAAERADYRKWNREVWGPAYRKQTYDDAKLLFPDRVADADAGATVCVEGPGDYRVYSVMGDVECVVHVGDSKLRLTLGDRLCDLLYYGKDTSEFQEFLSRVKAERIHSAIFW